jgi:hypothetical protein
LFEIGDEAIRFRNCLVDLGDEPFALRDDVAHLAFESAVYPMFADIHSDPRWLPFLRKNGMAPEQLAAIKFDVSLPQ